MNDLASVYFFIKALHIISIVTWFAALFYLPRLFVYHTSTTNTDTIATFKIMERKLYKFIANPSVAVVFLTGISLLMTNPGLIKQGGWMHAKIFLVISLLVYHIFCGRYMRMLAINNNKKSVVFYRWFNEYPSLVLVLVVILVVVRPF